MRQFFCTSSLLVSLLPYYITLQIAMEEEESPLDQLGVKFVDQDELEHDITKKANEALINKDTELDQKRLDKANNDYNKARLS